jgi:hypothetical protein
MKKYKRIFKQNRKLRESQKDFSPFERYPKINETSPSETLKWFIETYSSGKEYDRILKNFWVLTYPSTGSSTVGDVLFECTTVFDLVIQFMGGLKVNEIHMITKNYREALKWANIFVTDTQGIDWINREEE